MGEEIEIKLFKPIGKDKIIDGILIGYDEQEITIKYENDEISVPRKNIAMLKTKYDWES